MGTSATLRSPLDDITVNILVIFVSAVMIIGGAALVLKGKKTFDWMKTIDPTARWRIATQALFLGFMAAIGAIVAIFGLFRTPGGIASALLMIGTAVALIGSNRNVLLSPGRRLWIKKQWFELRRKRNPGEQYTPYGELVVRLFKFVIDFLGRLGTVDPRVQAANPRRRHGSSHADHSTTTVDDRVPAQSETGRLGSSLILKHDEPQRAPENRKVDPDDSA